MPAPHLVVDISAHGYGHLAQAAPVVGALRRRLPGLRVSVRGDLEPEVVRARVGAPVEVVPGTLDVALAMASALEVLPRESHRRYRDLHRDWDRRVAAAARDLTRLGPDLVLADVPYLSLAAAARAGVPAAALCSLNWADLYHAYCAGMPGSEAIHHQAREAYRQAALFLQPRPHMPMADLERRRSIAPIVRTATPRRGEVRARLGLPGDHPLVLVGLGGLDLRLPVESWAPGLGAHWLVPGRWGVRRPDVTPLEDLALPFPELLASVDLVVTKPGYGTFAEAAALGLPVLYLERPDWPESPYLEAWLAAHVPAAALPRSALAGGGPADQAARMLAMERPNPLSFAGEEEAAELLLPLIT